MRTYIIAEIGYNHNGNPNTARAICKGEVLSESNVTCKRPGNGICPMLWDEVIGRRAKKDFAEDELIEVEGIPWQSDEEEQ